MTSGQNPLTILIVTYNSRNQIRECVKSLVDRPDDVRVRVRDNGSTDSTPRILQSLADLGYIDDLILSDVDAGFAIAANDVISRSGGDDILLLNPDARIDLAAIRTMRDAVQRDPAVGAVSPVVANGDDVRVMSAGRQPRLWPMITHYSGLSRVFPHLRLMRGRHLFLRYHSTEDQTVEWTSGCCLLIPRRTIERVGLITERYFLYAEDTEYCKRITDSGLDVKVLAAVRVFHDVGTSEDPLDSDVDLIATDDVDHGPQAPPVAVTGSTAGPEPVVDIGTMWGRNLYDYYVREFRPNGPTRLAWRVTFTSGNLARALARRVRDSESRTADRLMRNALAIWN